MILGLFFLNYFVLIVFLLFQVNSVQIKTCELWAKQLPTMSQEILYFAALLENKYQFNLPLVISVMTRLIVFCEFSHFNRFENAVSFEHLIWVICFSCRYLVWTDGVCCHASVRMIYIRLYFLFFFFSLICRGFDWCIYNIWA